MIILRFCYSAPFLVGLFIFVANAAEAGQFTFTKIADSALGFRVGERPAINNSATVAFSATSAVSGNYTIDTFSGGAVRPLFLGFDFDSISAINSSGTVAFYTSRGPDPRIETIYRGNGGPLTTIADKSGHLATFTYSTVSPAINDSGRVVAFYGIAPQRQPGWVEGAYVGSVVIIGWVLIVLLRGSAPDVSTIQANPGADGEQVG